jgi:cytochrome c-type biogenesis protein CcmH/NrfG
MNKFKFFSIALFASVSVSYAQDLNQAKKAIDAEQFESAKSMLKAIIQAKPTNGTAAFILGKVYLTQSNTDSAKIYFDKGLVGTEGGKLNYIGLGQLELDKGNTAAAQTNFDLASKDLKKKDTETFMYIGKAYMDQNKPDFKSAITVLNKAKAVNVQDAQVLLALGNAFYGDKNQNDAYVAYRDAFQADNTLIRAKMQLGVLLKGAKAYTEAIKAYDEVIAMNASYGPVYRELAETYYLWGRNEPSKNKEYVDKALTYYEKYMSLTDYSLNSRMRHADFLIVARDYKALEIEANKMIELDKVNPRIFRYLGYAAYENGNYDVAIKSYDSFFANPSNKIISGDYLNLGLAKIKKAISADGKTIDASLFNAGISDVRKAVEMEAAITNNLSEVGKKLYEQKLFKEAGAIYEIATTNKESKNYLTDNFYLGNAMYYDNVRKDIVKPDPVALQKADVAYGNIIEASPSTQDAYVFRARTNSLLGNDAMMVKYYDQYITTVTAKGVEELAKPAIKTKFIEAYNNMGASYANTDKIKAKEYFTKTLALDPANTYAAESLKLLK